MKSSVDGSLRLDLPINGFSIVIRYLEKWFQSFIRDGKRCSLLSCRPIHFVSVLCCVATSSLLRTNKMTECACTGHQLEMTRLLRNKEQRRSKPDENWVMAELTIINPWNFQYSRISKFRGNKLWIVKKQRSDIQSFDNSGTIISKVWDKNQLSNIGGFLLSKLSNSGSIVRSRK